MKRLFKLREWLTVPETARHLSDVFGEPVTEADVLQLAIDGHYKISVKISSTTARLGDGVPPGEAKIEFYRDGEDEPLLFKGPYKGTLGQPADEIVPDEIMYGLANGSIRKIVGDVQLDDDLSIHFRDDITAIEGIWDLPMARRLRGDTEYLIRQISAGHKEAALFDGVILERNDSVFAQLQCRDERENKRADQTEGQPRKSYFDPANWRAATELPDDTILVVRTTALADFITRTAEAEVDVEPEKESTRRINTLLRIIAVMAHQKYSKDIEAPYTIAAHIEQKAGELGIDISKQTIADKVSAALKLTTKGAAAS